MARCSQDDLESRWGNVSRSAHLSQGLKESHGVSLERIKNTAVQKHDRLFRQFTSINLAFRRGEILFVITICDHCPLRVKHFTEYDDEHYQCCRSCKQSAASGC